MDEVQYADVAQLAEQLICNQQVNGSSPFIGLGPDAQHRVLSGVPANASIRGERSNDEVGRLTELARSEHSVIGCDVDL